MRPFRFDQPVRTARLILRPITMGDLDDVHSYMSRADVAEWLPEDAYTIANLDVRNVGSGALCRRLGMRLEAHHVHDSLMKGEWIDILTYAVLATEWASRDAGVGPEPT